MHGAGYGLALLAALALFGTGGKAAETGLPEGTEAKVHAIAQTIVAHPGLDPAFWPDGQPGRLDPTVRKALLRIGEVFLDHSRLREKLAIRDIVFAGSLTGYLYHSRSDIDVHIHVDARAIGLPPDLTFMFLSDRSQVASEGREFTVRGRKVQVFLLDIVHNKEGSSGVYSLRDDRWTRLPARPDKPIDTARVADQALALVRQHFAAIEAYRKNPKSVDCNVFFEFTRELKRARRQAFDAEGEYAMANLVYKTLRNGRYTREAETMNARCLADRLNLP